MLLLSYVILDSSDLTITRHRCDIKMATSQQQLMQIYYKVRQKFSIKCTRYYKVQQVVSRKLADITKCDRLLVKVVRYYKVWQAVITKCFRYYKVCWAVITKRVRYYKVWQAINTKFSGITMCRRLLVQSCQTFQSATGCYYKVCQVLESVIGCYTKSVRCYKVWQVISTKLSGYKLWQATSIKFSGITKGKWLLVKSCQVLQIVKGY